MPTAMGAPEEAEEMAAEVEEAEEMALVMVLRVLRVVVRIIVVAVVMARRGAADGGTRRVPAICTTTCRRHSVT